MVANTRAGSRRKTVVKLSKEIVRAQREGDWPDTVPVHHIPALITELACLQQRLAARLLGEQSADEGDLSGDTLLDVKAAAERLGISADWLYRRAPQQAVGKMTDGPSTSAVRSRLQTTPSGCH